MTAYDLHREGDCGPSCPICAQECAACGEFSHWCTCPQLPLDEETP